MKREKLNWMVGNRERGPGAAFAQRGRALPTPENKQALYRSVLLIFTYGRHVCMLLAHALD